mgnify:CR=1 FL=1|jgi:prolyl oligopeptidase
MKIIKFLFLVVIGYSCTKNKNKPIKMLPEQKVVDKYFGVEVEDSYRYMENTSDSIVINWYKQQSKYSKNQLHKITNRDKIIDFQNKTRGSKEIKVFNLQITNNNIYFYLKNNKDVKELFFRKGITGKEHLLLNPNNFKKGYSINYISPNWDGSKIAIAVTKDDLEIGDIIIFDVIKNVLFQEIINNCWPSALGGVKWLSDNKRFTYEYIPIIDKNNEDYLLNIETRMHIVSQQTVNDITLFSKTNNPEITIKEEDFPEITFKDEKSKYMFGGVWGASYYPDHYYSLVSHIDNEKITWKPLFKKENLIKNFYIKDDEIFFLTAYNAENFQISKTSLINPDFENPKVLIPEDEFSVITDFTLTDNGMFYVKTNNGVDAKLLKFQDDLITEIQLPKKSGSVNVSSKGAYYSDLWIEIKGWLSDKERYSYNHKTNNFIKEILSKKNDNNDELFEGIIVKEIEITSHDGVKIPLSLIYNKNIELNGDNRVLIKGYGAYGVAQRPFLDPYILPWLKEGGVYAVAHVRGGGEKGDAWHKGGYKTTKPNSWKDLIACTEYLIDNNYSSKNTTTIYSGSAGGILVGRALTERPDLFSVAIIRVGLLNTLRLEFAPNGKNNTKEFGSIKDSIGFRGLLEMDAYHHIQKGVNYPSLYLTAGLNDSRVAVWQPGKFAAKIQRANTSDNPILFNVDFKGGHGLDASKNKKNEEVANILSFALWQTGHPDYQPKK